MARCSLGPSGEKDEPVSWGQEAGAVAGVCVCVGGGVLDAPVLGEGE